MRHENIYRLGEYRITAYENGLLRWETHSNFGVQRSGKCFILGNILIFQNWSNEESGYLQLEFSELLQKLPVWNRTNYYCFASELLAVSTGQRLTNDFLEPYIALRSTASNPLMNMSPGMFRLGRYQITIDDNGKVSWQTYEGLRRVVSGRCVIESEVLFIGQQEYEEGNQNKRGFLNMLYQLPKWDRSVAWCRNEVLRSCHVETRQIANFGSTTSHQYIMEEPSFDEKTSTLNLYQYQKPSKRLLRVNFKWLETTWHYMRRGKRWLKYLIPLILVGLLLGLVMIWYSVEKKSLFPHGGKQHHREHDD